MQEIHDDIVIRFEQRISPNVLRDAMRNARNAWPIYLVLAVWLALATIWCGEPRWLLARTFGFPQFVVFTTPKLKSATNPTTSGAPAQTPESALGAPEKTPECDTKYHSEDPSDGSSPDCMAVSQQTASLDVPTAIYFNVAMLSTVGASDISPKNHSARIVSVLDSIAGLVLLGLVISMLSASLGQDRDATSLFGPVRRFFQRYGPARLRSVGSHTEGRQPLPLATLRKPLSDLSDLLCKTSSIGSHDTGLRFVPLILELLSSHSFEPTPEHEVWSAALGMARSIVQREGYPKSLSAADIEQLSEALKHLATTILMHDLGQKLSNDKKDDDMQVKKI